MPPTLIITTDFTPLAPRIGGLSGHTLGLTHRQADVLRLLVQGKPNKLICRDLRLSEGTVKVHVSAILKALNVRSRAQAIPAHLVKKRHAIRGQVAARTRVSVPARVLWR